MPNAASPDSSPSGALEIRGSSSGLLDEPFLLRVRGAGPDAELTWRARYRDDDGRVWRAAASRCEDLATVWAPQKDGTGELAALRSLRPLSIDVRVETADGRAATRAFTRLFAAEGMRSRRWRDGLSATLHVPARPTPRAIADADAAVQANAGPRATAARDAAGRNAQANPRATAALDVSADEARAVPRATVILDATGGEAQATVATLAAPLLASRGVLVLTVAAARGRADPIELARERLAAVPGATEPIVLPALDPFGMQTPAIEGVVLAPGVGARDTRPHAAQARAVAWDALLLRLGATPRERPTPQAGRVSRRSS